MATNYKDLDPGAPITITGSLKAKPGKGNDVAQHLSNLKARANSNVEPGTLSYNIVRYGDSFAIFEDYANAEALENHRANPLFQVLIAAGIVESLTPLYYPSKSLPAPTMTFKV